jgi:hypothetical protein
MVTTVRIFILASYGVVSYSRRQFSAITTSFNIFVTSSHVSSPAEWQMSAYMEKMHRRARNSATLSETAYLISYSRFSAQSMAILANRLATSRVS